MTRPLLQTLVLSCALSLATTALGENNVFRNVAKSLGLKLSGNRGAWGDYDNDGFVDLFADGALWRNEGGKKFTRIQVSAGGSAIWGDFDNDGDLDLYGCEQHRLLRNDGAGGFVDVSKGLAPARGKSRRCATWGDFDGDGFLDLYIGGTEGPGYQPNTVLHNKGDGTFEQRWQPGGKARPTRGITTADFDEDGDLDVYISNYRLEPNLLWQNDGKGAFREVGRAFGVWGDGGLGAWGHTIGSCWGDLDNDGHLGLFVGNFSHAPSYQDRPKFLRNKGPEGGFRFEEKTGKAGLHWQESYASPSLGDYDNDGDLDLYFTTVYGTASRGIKNYPVLYRNEGNWRFVNVTAETGLSHIGPTYQAAWADFDNDGDLDLLTNGRLYQNNTPPQHWLEVRLRGGGKVNRDAIGAQVRIRLGDRIMTRQKTVGTGASNQNSPTLHFGLGDHGEDVELLIRWPQTAAVQKVKTQVDRVVVVEMKTE